MELMTWTWIQLQINLRRLPLSVMEHKAGGWLVEQETGKVLASDPRNAQQIIQGAQSNESEN